MHPRDQLTRKLMLRLPSRTSQLNHVDMSALVIRVWILSPISCGSEIQDIMVLSSPCRTGGIHGRQLDFPEALPLRAEDHDMACRVHGNP